MNVDEIQKINRLAKELLSHGIAASSNDAVAKAEQMIRGMPQAEERAVQETPEPKRDELHELDNMVKYLSNDFRALSGKVAGLSEENRRLRGDIVDLRRQISSMSMQAPSNKPPEMPRQQAQQTTTRQEPNPEDVAIEKIFYFGQK